MDPQSRDELDKMKFKLPRGRTHRREKKKIAEIDVSPVAVLVLNFNGKQYLEQCLDSLLATTYPNFDVTVVDNGSSDGSTKFIKSNYPNVKLKEHHRNYGYALGYNLVIDSIETEHIALINTDIITEPSWLEKLMEHVKDNDVAAVVPKMKFPDKKRINSAGGSCDIFGTGWNRGNGEIERNQFNVAQEVFYGNGGAFLFKKQVWQEIGPFDERYFMYGEDLDWCWRARLRGYKIVYVPHAEVYHHWRGSGGAIVVMLEKHWLSNILKNYDLKTLIKIMPRYLALKALKTIWLLIHSKPEEKFSVFEAILWNLLNLKGTWMKRVRTQRSRKKSDTEIQKNMLRKSFELLLWSRKITHPISDFYKQVGDLSHAQT
jgi:GT2 family glycosyltransferase